MKSLGVSDDEVNTIKQSSLFLMEIIIHEFWNSSTKEPIKVIIVINDNQIVKDEKVMI